MPNFTCIVCAICAVERVILTPTRLTVELKLFVAPSLPRLPAPIATANTGSLSWPLRSGAYQFVCIGCPHAMRVLALNKTHDASDSVAFPTLNPWFYSKFQRASNRHKIDKTVKSKVHFMFLSNALKTFRIALGRNYYIILASIRCQRLSKAPLSWTGASKWRHLTTCYVLPAPTSLLSDSLQLFHRLWHLPPLEYRSFSPEHLLHAIWSALGHATPLHRFLLLMHSIGLRQLAMQGDLRKTCICCNYVWACVIHLVFIHRELHLTNREGQPSTEYATSQEARQPNRFGVQNETVAWPGIVCGRHFVKQLHIALGTIQCSCLRRDCIGHCWRQRKYVKFVSKWCMIWCWQLPVLRKKLHQHPLPGKSHCLAVERGSPEIRENH